MRQLALAACLVSTWQAAAVAADQPRPAGGDLEPLKADRILFLGDSITHAGHYVALLEAELWARGVEKRPDLINLGLPSETCSGLSEPDHPFPRPDVHERIDRALERTRPDIVVACYGMNDGIYYPFSEERFAAYQRGINRLIEKVHDSGAKLVLLTPPPFDPEPLRAKGKLLPATAPKFAWFSIYEDYDKVLEKYSDWVKQQADRVALVVDARSAVQIFLTKERQTKPDLILAGDGVHINALGHQQITKAILRAWGLGNELTAGSKLQQAVAKKQTLLHNAWLSHVGHKRPGMKAGLPIEQARTQASQLDKQIGSLVDKETR